jgi:hypothetical protein
MAHDSIPGPDPSFHGWLGDLNDYLQANAPAMGVSSDDANALKTVTGAWNLAYPIHKNTAAAATAAATNKDQARQNAEAVVRPLIQQLQASPKVTDAQRNSMKINVRATTRTRAGVPATAPMATVDTSQRLRHILNYRDAATPQSRQKPAGVAYCEIWAKVGAPAPTDVSQLTYLGNASKTPQMEEYSGAQAGQTVCYWLRWVNTRGEKGPWSEPVTATIPG